MVSRQASNAASAKDPYVQIFRPPNTTPIEFRAGSMAYLMWAIGNSEFLVDLGVKTRDMLVLRDGSGRIAKCSYVDKNAVFIHHGEPVPVISVFSGFQLHHAQANNEYPESYGVAWNSFWFSAAPDDMMATVMTLGYNADDMLSIMIEIFENVIRLNPFLDRDNLMLDLCDVVKSIPDADPSSVRKEIGAYIAEVMDRYGVRSLRGGVIVHSLLPMIDMRYDARLWKDPAKRKYAALRRSRIAYYFLNAMHKLCDCEYSKISDIALKVIMSKIKFSHVLSLVYNNGESSADLNKTIGTWNI